MTLKRTFDVTVTLLAPLHIGTGRELMRGYDYAVHNGQAWILNADAILDAKAIVDAQGRFVDAQGRPDDRVLRLPPAELLDADDFRNGQTGSGGLFRYTLPGAPRSQERGAILREQYKDAFSRPYIPGSSLKGALRTVLAWHGFQARGLKLDVGQANSRSWAAQPLERKIFGPNPYHDLLRALHVADSAPVAADHLFLVNAQVVTGGEKPGSPIELEAVRPDTAFTTTVTIDAFLHGAQAEEMLRFGERWSWLEQLPAVGRAWALQQLSAERAWFQQRKYDRIAGLYGQMVAILKANKLAAGQFFLQVGWGAGWGAKTFGAALRADTKAFEDLLSNKRLSPARIRRRAGDPFPKSRRVMVQNGQPVAPFGWCLVEMKERK